MIILDTCVIREMRLDGIDAHLLRAIRETETERVGAPWMVLEERAAQLAIEHTVAHEKALSAYKQLERATPWPLPALPASDPELVREHWRSKLGELVEQLDTSENALRQGMYREANTIPPAGKKKDIKTGARDVAIWLSAVEYARAHPQENVYFVSGNTKDFTNGTGPYPAPMDKDLEGLKDRFVHLTELAQLLGRLAPPVEVTTEQVEKLLPAFTDQIRDAVMERWGNTLSLPLGHFSVLQRMTGQVTRARGWFAVSGTPHVKAVKVTDAQGYQLGGREWCTATVDWQIIGVAYFGDAVGSACGVWKTHVMMPLDEDGMELRILSAGLLEAPADSQDVEWPDDLPDSRYARMSKLMDALEGASKWERALAIMVQAVTDSPDPEHVATFLKSERRRKALADAEDDARADMEMDMDGDDHPWFPASPLH